MSFNSLSSKNPFSVREDRIKANVYDIHDKYNSGSHRYSSKEAQFILPVGPGRFLRVVAGKWGFKRGWGSSQERGLESIPGKYTGRAVQPGLMATAVILFGR